MPRATATVEALKTHGVEVLLLHERIDEWMIGYLTEYEGKKATSPRANWGSRTGRGAPTAADQQEQVKAAEGLLEKLKTALGDRVSEVRVSQRLTDSPACLVGRALTWPAHAAPAESRRA